MFSRFCPASISTMRSTRDTERNPSSPPLNPASLERSFIMDPLAAKFLGAGLACIGMGRAAIGVATIFGQFLAGGLRKPSAAAGQTTTLYLRLALAEAFGIFSLLIALLLLFVLLGVGG